MSNVRIEATGEFALTIEVTLGANMRKRHKVAPGDSIELSVAGNQKLSIAGVSEDDAATAEPAVLPTGVDVSENTPEPEAPAGEAPGGGEPPPAVEGAGEAPSGDISALAEGETGALGEAIENPFDTPGQ